MCTYCMIADWGRKWYPDPGDIRPRPYDWPVVPETPWTRPQLNEWLDLLKKVQELEEKVEPCPCPEAEKLDYLKDIKKRLDKLEKKLQDKNDSKILF